MEEVFNLAVLTSFQYSEQVSGTLVSSIICNTKFLLRFSEYLSELLSKAQVWDLAETLQLPAEIISHFKFGLDPKSLYAHKLRIAPCFLCRESRKGIETHLLQEHQLSQEAISNYLVVFEKEISLKGLLEIKEKPTSKVGSHLVCGQCWRRVVPCYFKLHCLEHMGMGSFERKNIPKPKLQHPKYDNKY